MLLVSSSCATLEGIKTVIFEESRGPAFANYVWELLNLLGAPSDDAIAVIEDAWNLFPHRRLGGCCPAEVRRKGRDLAESVKSVRVQTRRRVCSRDP